MDPSDSDPGASWFPSELQCGICENLMSNPRSLDCSHSFCLDPLHQVNQNRAGRAPSSKNTSSNHFKSSVSCPVCDQKTPLTSGDLSILPADKSVTRSLESLSNFDLGHRYKAAPSPHAIADPEEWSADIMDNLSEEAIDLPSFVTSVESEYSLEGDVLESDDKSSEHGEGRVVAVANAATPKSGHGSQSIRSLRSWTTRTESSAASNKVRARPDSNDIDSSNMSLLFSSDTDSATEKSFSNKTPSKNEGSHGQSGIGESDDSLIEPVNVTIKRVCEQHPGMPLQFFCSLCRVAICNSCVEGPEHRGHVVEDLQDAADSMRGQLETLLRCSADADAVLEKALQTLISQQNEKNALVDQLDTIVRQVKATSQTMVREIFGNMNKILAEVSRLRQALSLDHLDSLRQDIRVGRRLASDVKRRGDSVDVVNTHKAISRKLKRAANLCAEGGTLDQLQDIAVCFSPLLDTRAVLEIGTIQEESGWKIHQKLPIPLDKRGTMQGMTSLNGRLAVGYEAGGIDVFNLRGKNGQPDTRILPTTKIVDLVSTAKDTLIVYPMFGDIKEVTMRGEELPSSFPSSASQEHVSLSRSADGRVFLGFAEFNEIHQFHYDGGFAKDVLSTSKYKPQQIDVTSSGKILFKDKNGVRILDLSTKDVRTVVRASKGKFVYCTCDVNDNVYVAEVAGRDGRAIIMKYTTEGKRMDTAHSDITMQRTSSGHHWLRLIALSPFKLAVCDGSFISIFQRRPSIIEMANEMNL